MTKEAAPKCSPSCSGGSGRKLELRVRSSEDARVKKKPHGKKMPKKPPTAFFYFLEDFRKEYQEQHPQVKSMRQIGKTCGEKWKTMTYEEKVKYYDIATEKRQEFHRAITDYTKTMDSETDSDFSQ